MSVIHTIKAKYDQLESVNRTLMEELRQLSSEDLLFKPDVNSWCIIQVLDHVKNAELGTLLYMKKKMKYGGLKKINWSAGIRTVLMNLVNNSSIRFKMPSVLPQPAATNTLDEIMAEWEQLRKKWHEFIGNFPPENLDMAVFRHPIFGRLSLRQSMDSMISHQNHHIKQIDRIKKAIELHKKQ